MPNISDLTGTTWEINSSPEIIDATFEISFTSNEESFTRMLLNPTNTSINYRLGTASWTTAFAKLPPTQPAHWTIEAYRTIIITGGTDVTNATLISWLEENATQIQSGTPITIDLTQLTNYSTLPRGTYTIKSRALGEGSTYTSSNRSTGVIYSYAYAITSTIANGSISGATALMPNSSTTLTIVPSTNYTYPTTVTVTGATSSYNNTNGQITLSNPTADIVITATCVLIQYSITTSVTGGTYSGATQIDAGGTATVTITPSAGYALPATVTVTNATSSYNSTTGVISLSNPTGNVTISAACLEMAETPTTSLSGDTLTIESSEEATSFDLYDNGVFVTNIPTTTG